MTVGTPGYMAPEVLRGKDPSSLSDVFSLACVLVYAARGTGPFGTGDPLAIAHRSANGEPDLTGVPDDVKALVTPMLQQDPARRPTPAQLLQHVSLSSSVMLHDGLWLPESVRGLLSSRKQELQQALGWTMPPAPAGPTAAAPPPAQPAPSYSYAVPPPTPPSDFAALHGTPMPAAPAPARSRKGFYALLAAAGAVVMTGAVVAVLLLDKGGNHPSNTANGSTTSAPVVHSSAANDVANTDSASSDSTSDNTSDAAAYKPGTYSVNQEVATDILGDTVNVDSVTVDNDGTVSVKLTYTAVIASEWGCAGSKAGEATLQIDDGDTDSSTGSDCTRDPSKTWNMGAGQSFSGSEYFASAPTGDGSWTFSMTTATPEGITEFQGSVSDISIPTQ
jgi:hypothetical protein